jgi:Uma2 family endonuclease
MAVTLAKYTRADYFRLPEGFPAELVEGTLVKEPSPTYWHQSIVGELHLRLHALLGPRRVLVAPADVIVDDYNVLQPDVLVLEEKDRVHRKSPKDAVPVLVMEVLSPATASLDRDTKAGLYLKAGVREVWLVDPETETVAVRTPEGERVHASDEPAESAAVAGFRVSFGDLS